MTEQNINVIFGGRTDPITKDTIDALRDQIQLSRQQTKQDARIDNDVLETEFNR